MRHLHRYILWFGNLASFAGGGSLASGTPVNDLGTAVTELGAAVKVIG
jgi:hypothetical protein